MITFKGNYEGTVTKTFTIGQMDSELKYAKSSVTVDYKGGAVVDNAYTSKASAKDIKFTTSNKNVAAVDSEGNVTIVVLVQLQLQLRSAAAKAIRMQKQLIQ